MSTGVLTDEPAVVIDHLVRTFGPVRAVDDLSLTIRQGEVVAFLGPNGAGKTTTLDVVLGLGHPDGGSVSVMGMPPRRAIGNGLISAVLQTGGLLKDVTIEETVSLVASFYQSPRPVAEVLERAGLTELARRRVGKCSGGEQQRLRFALALIPDPAVLVLDEPTAGMDVAARRAFWAAIHEDAGRGRTIVFATHYLEEAETYADRIVLVNRGRIVADGTTAEVTSQVTGRVVEATLPTGDLTTLRAIPGVTDATLHGTRLNVATTDSDAVARYLLTHTAAYDITIASRGLEDAFIALTGTDA